jgi:hypothetical protein
VKCVEIVEPVWTHHGLAVTFVAETVVDDIVFPHLAKTKRADGLWQTTCFELFIRRQGHVDYIEYNLSPSGEWAAYRFESYRKSPHNLSVQTAPKITFAITTFDGLSTVHRGPGLASMDMILELPTEWRQHLLELNMAAVIEETDGTKSYWALAHPPGAPDFHHPDCFALTLAAPDAP